MGVVKLQTSRERSGE